MRLGPWGRPTTTPVPVQTCPSPQALAATIGCVGVGRGFAARGWQAHPTTPRAQATAHTGKPQPCRMMPWHNTTLGPICMIAQACLSFFPTLAHRAHASQRLGAGPPGLDWPKIVREADQAVQRHGGRPAGQHSIYPNILTVCGITVYFSIYPSILQ